jgi:hypothetical protein
MRRSSDSKTGWLILILMATIPRILGAFFLPNAFGDAYVYIRDIGVMSTKLSTGSFALTDLYGFWLPLYQFISAVVNVFVGNGFYSGKIVSALFGVGSCLLIYSIVLRLTANRAAALLSFALIALNPLHIFNSASAMTDVPFAFFVLASLYFVLRRGWVLAAICAALAGLTRVEGWMFIALIPVIQLLRERRVSLLALVIMCVPPLLWFYISWKATGDWLACFRARQQYHDWLMAANPALASISFGGILRDGAALLVSTDLAVLIASFVAGWFVLKRFPGYGRPQDSTDEDKITGPVLFFFAFLAFLLAAYLSRQAPIIYPRYGLILFNLGIPILAWTFLMLRQRKPQWARTLLISIVVICVLDWGIQFTGAVGMVSQYRAQRAAADYLRTHYQFALGGLIFSDEGNVTVLSGIAPEKFLTSSEAPKDREGFLAFLSEKNVEYLVFEKKAGSTPAKLFPELEHGNGVGLFEPVMNGRTEYLRTNIWLYRVRKVSEARP